MQNAFQIIKPKFFNGFDGMDQEGGETDSVWIALSIHIRFKFVIIKVAGNTVKTDSMNHDFMDRPWNEL